VCQAVGRPTTSRELLTLSSSMLGSRVKIKPDINLHFPVRKPSAKFPRSPFPLGFKISKTSGGTVGWALSLICSISSGLVFWGMMRELRRNCILCLSVGLSTFIRFGPSCLVWSFSINLALRTNSARCGLRIIVRINLGRWIGLLSTKLRYSIGSLRTYM
jgi:hypothetical protein